MNRRDFFKIGGLSGLWLTLGQPADLFAAQNLRRILVLIELKGGNDGMNTVIPFADPEYVKLRPKIHIPQDQVLRLSEQVGLHPSMTPLMKSWQAKDLAILQGVGYPKPNRSHFRSIEIWETGSASDEHLYDGWLARSWRGRAPAELLADAVILGGDDGPARGERFRAISTNNVQQLTRRTKQLATPQAPPKQTNAALDHVLRVHAETLAAAQGLAQIMQRKPELGVSFPSSPLGRELQLAAELIVADAPLLVLKAAIGGFDTHSQQLGRHAKLLEMLSEAMAALREALIKAGKWEQVVVMTYSEFGRRAAQNGSQGSDHGTSAPHLVMGGRVMGGLYGRYPSLTELEGGDLKHHLDFRAVYRTLEAWWSLPTSFPEHQALALFR
jgi:uncharacterized protein (DUF1501 family)